MIDHRRALFLAATAIDFDLDPAERRQLDEHLAGCAACTSDTAALRADAALLAALPPIEPPAWVRRAIGRPRGPQRAVLLVAAALLLVVTVGVALAVGAAVRDRIVPPVVPPSPPITAPSPSGASPSAASTPVASGAVSPLPSVSPGAVPVVTTTSFPAGSGSAWIGPGPDGSVWVLADHPGEGDAGASVAVFGLIDSAGQPRPGWPLRLDGWRCAADGPPHGLPIAADGSIRLVCAQDTLVDGPQRHVGFAFDIDGQALPGWPIELPATGLTNTAVVVGDELHLVASEIASTEGQASSAQAAAWWQVVVSATGDVRTGRRYEVADAAGNFDVRLAADGIAYRLTFSGTTAAIRTEITGFDLDGIRTGWPVTVDGIASQPVVGPDGGLVARLMKPGLSSHVVFIGPAGAAEVTASADLPIDPLDDRTGAGAVLLGPIVAADGSAWVVGTVDSTKPAVVRVAPDGSIGQPIPLDLPLQPQGACSGQDTGCGVWRAVPVVGPDGTLYIPESAVGGPGLSSSSGGSLVAIRADGSTRTGWPVFLPDSMAGFWTVLARPDGTVDALAVVATDAGNVWALQLLGPDGSVRSSTPISQP